MKTFYLFLFLVAILSGCSTAQKARLESRDRAAQQSGLYCDFVNEADFKDVDVELNLRLANKCTSNKPFSISGYKRFNESQGFMFCCNLKDGAMSSKGPVAEEKEVETREKETTTSAAGTSKK